MAVFRVEKTKDFTIMSNHHLRNTELSLKAKGLLSLMLSLPEDWDYTTKGLAHICKDGVDSITTALKELERHGYLTRQRLRYDNGQLGDIEYTIHEQPVSTENIGLSPKRENPRQVKPEQAKPKQAEPEQANPAQLNTNPLKTKKSKKDKSITYPSIYPAEPEAANRTDGMDRIELIEAYREIIKENIEYDLLVLRYGRERLDETLAGYVEVPEQTASPESAPDPTEPKRDDTDIVLPSVDFETLRENGPDIIGWLSLPDTVLNYPVTQTDNNEYYLNHLYDGTYNKVGCLFADYENRADFSDRNTIIYGHNMRDGSMFALLNRYDEQSYFDAHRQMYLVTPKGGYVMEIFAAFAAKPEESGSETSPWQLSWKDDGAYTTWLTAMKERSAVESDVTVTCSDKVLTLSTCTPGGTGRFLVMGKLVKVDNEI